MKLEERGDSFTSVTLSCLCKDGFVGDGIICYDVKLCSESSCCSSGYHWSPEKGCVDIDECSLSPSPCASSQVCKNTPGAFECFTTPSRSRLGTSSKSVQFSCGNPTCPSGMDCITSNGTARCADPCEHYTVLDDPWRATDYRVEEPKCDNDVDWQGWYRFFLDGNSAHLPERCVEQSMCGTYVDTRSTSFSVRSH